MRPTWTIAAAAVAGLLASLPLSIDLARADGRATRPDILAADQVKPGMKGYGLTVFEGTTPSRFEVEVINVLDNFRPRQELILIKTKHPRLEVTKVVAGMSGSPIYVGDKMIGAYAYGWTFGKEPVAGVTPIRSMLDDLDRPLPATIHGVPLDTMPGKKRASVGGQANPTHRYAGDLVDYDIAEHADQIGSRNRRQLGYDGNSALEPVATPLLMGGMTPSAIEAIRDVLSPLGLEPVQAGGGGGTKKDAPTRYVDGGAIGVQMVRGDMSAMGLGTVTRVEGEKLIGFGHPMMNIGVTSLPTAIGQVYWFMASQMRSFKIGEAVRPVGALVNDRLASIVVSQDTQPPIIPVRLKLSGEPGAPYDIWNFEVAHDKFMTPAFLGVALGSALEAAAAERRDVTWSARGMIRTKGYGDLVIDDYGASPTGTPQVQEMMRAGVVRAAGAILNNPWQDARVEAVDYEIELTFAREILTLRGAELLDPELDPGQPARIRLTYEVFGKPNRTQVISVPIPRRFAGQTLKLDIAPGYSVEKVRASPESLTELIANLEDPVYPPKSLVVSFESGSGGIAYRGRVAKNLPPGAIDAFATTNGSLAPATFDTEVRHVVDLPMYLVGRDSLTVSIRPEIR